MHPVSCLSNVAIVCGVLLLFGCRSEEKRVPFDPIPLAQAAGIVNRNIAKIGGTLKASGAVDGSFTTPDGRRHSYHLDGTLFYLAPAYLRFDLKSFGSTQILFGSNDQRYWCYIKNQDAYHCGLHGDREPVPSALPARPDQLIDALGLTHLSGNGSDGTAAQLAQRVVGDHQQILYLVPTAGGGVRLEKEYWLDRYSPQLVRRVVFRDPDGVVEMESLLSDYKPLTPTGPWLAHVMVAEWPKEGARMRFTVHKWTTVYQVRPDGVQFATPSACRGFLSPDNSAR